MCVYGKRFYSLAQGLADRSSGHAPGLLLMSQLVAGQTDVITQGSSGVHKEQTVGGSDLENETLVFSGRF